MCDHSKLRIFELVDKVAVFVNRVTAGFPRENIFVEMLRLLDDQNVLGFEEKIVETEKVLNGLIRTLQEYGPSVFSLQSMHLNSYSALKYKRKSQETRWTKTPFGFMI